MDVVAKRGRTARATVPLLVGLGVQSATTYVVLVIAGRALGATKFGSLSALYVLIASISTGLFLPLEQEVARRRGDERSRDRSDHTLLIRSARLGAYASIAASAILLAAFPVTLRLLGHEPQLVAALCVSLPGYAFCFITRGEFAGQRELARYGVQLGVEGGFRLFGGIALALAGVDNVVWYGWLFALAPWIALGVSGIGWKPRRLNDDAHIAAGLGRAVALLVVSCLASQLLVNAGPLVVALLARSSERANVGVFLAALVLVRVPVFLFTAVQPSFLPAMAAHSAADRRQDFVQLITRVLLAASAFVMVSALLAVTIGPFAVRVLFGFKQGLSRWTFGQMTVSVGLFLIAMILAQALLGRGRHTAAVLGWLAGLTGLAVGTALGHTAVERAGAGFLAGAACATAVLGAFLARDLWRWTSDQPEVTTSVAVNRSSTSPTP